MVVWIKKEFRVKLLYDTLNFKNSNSNLGNYTTSRISFVTMASSNLQDKQKKNGIVQLIRTHFSLTVTCWAQSLFIFCLQKPGTQRLHRMIRTRQKKKV